MSESDEDFIPDSYDRNTGMVTLIHHSGNQPKLTYMIKRLKGDNGNPIGKLWIATYMR